MTIPAYMLKPIKTKHQATRFINHLHQDGLLFHFDDDPREIVNPDGFLFDEATSQALESRIDEMHGLVGYDLHGKALDALNKGF